MDFMHKYILRQKQENNGLVDEIRRTVCELRSARQWFESESDSDLIEACVYHQEALEAKYRYLLRAAKDSGLSCDAITREVEEKQSA